MPKTVRVKAPPERREVEQLKAHGRRYPPGAQHGRQRPRLPRLGVPLQAPQDPGEVVDHPRDDVDRHVIPVPPPHERQVSHVREVQRPAQRRPRPQPRPRPPVRPVEPEDAHEDVVEPVHDGRAGAEVVQALGDAEVARVEDGAEDPRCYGEVGEELVELQEGVGGGHFGAELGEAAGVGVEVPEGEEDGEGLLEAGDAGEGPFAVELDDGGVGGYALGRGGLLAVVVAFGGAVPEEESAVECYAGQVFG